MASAMAALAAAAAAAVRPGEKRQRRQSAYRLLHVCWGWATAPAKPFWRLPWRKKKTQWKRNFKIIKQWIILYTTGNKRLWAHGLVFHLLTTDIFTAGYHADGMDPSVCGSTWFLWMFHLLQHSSWLHWCICTLEEVDAVKIIVHNATILCVQLIIHNVIHIYCINRGLAIQCDTEAFGERKSEAGWERGTTWTNTERELWFKKNFLSRVFQWYFLMYSSDQMTLNNA